MEPRRIGLDRTVWERPATILLLLLGGFLFLVGWIAGVVLLWSSGAWTLRDKVIGTLVVPFGVVLPLLAVWTGLVGGSGESVGPCADAPEVLCTGTYGGWHVPHGTVVFVAVFLAPCVTAVYLWRRARRSTV